MLSWKKLIDIGQTGSMRILINTKRSRHCLAWLVLISCVVWSSTAAPLLVDYTHSRIEVAVSSTLTSFTGKLERFQADIEFEPSAALPSKTVVTFDFKDLKTGVAGRDTHMLKWLQYSQNPSASFRLRSWKQDGNEPVVRGDLTLHGVKREIQIPVTVKHQQAQYEIDGMVGLDYRDFGLRKIREAGVLSVNPHVKVMFHLSGKLDHAP